MFDLKLHNIEMKANDLLDMKIIRYMLPIFESVLEHCDTRKELDLSPTEYLESHDITFLKVEPHMSGSQNVGFVYYVKGTRHNLMNMLLELYTKEENRDNPPIEYVTTYFDRKAKVYGAG